MMTLVTGGKESGKSRFAEDLVCKEGFLRRYYIATMQVVDEESRIRRERHRKDREGKGFETFEIPCFIDAAPSLMTDPMHCSVLLECVANLVGNIMHTDEWEGRIADADNDTVDEITDHILGRIRSLSSAVGSLTVVSYVCEEAPEDYADEETRLYLRILGESNRRLKRIAERVYNL